MYIKKRPESCVTKGMTQISREHKTLKESILDIQARSIQDNLIFLGIPEQPTANGCCQL